MTTIQSAINNTNVSVNTRDVLAGLLKLYNYYELAKYNSLTPSMVDSFYLDYRDGLNSNNNAIGNYSIGTFSKEYQPCGVYPVALYDLNGNKLNTLKITADDTGTNQFPSILTTTEPLLFLSPFISDNSF